MGYILHRGSDQRFVLQSAETGLLVGLLFPPIPGESRQSFTYNFGSTSDRQEIINIADFPELADLEFFTIEYPGFCEYDRAFNSPNWESVRSLFGSSAKAIGYNHVLKEKVVTPLTALWQYTPPNLKGSWKIPAWALWVNQNGVWMGNRDGLILAFNHQGEVLNQYQLVKDSRSVLATQDSLYALCDDGQVYDLSSSKLPQSVYNTRTSDLSIYYDFSLLTLTIQDDAFFILDIYGNLTCLNDRWQRQWQNKTKLWQGWFLQADFQAVYVGHFHGVTCFDRQTGKLIWHQPTSAPVLSGVLLSDRVLVGTSNGSLYSLSKSGQTEIESFGTCDGAVYSSTFSQDASLLIAADNRANLYGFTLTGEPIWQHSVNCGSILNLQTWGDYLYAVTTDGTLACFDLKVLASAPLTNVSHQPPSTPIQKTRSPASQTNTLKETVSPLSETGVLVECYKQGSQLKVRAISPGYRTDWNVKFPRNLRQAGMRYQVKDLVEAKQGGFYRVVGTIEPFSDNLSKS